MLPVLFCQLLLERRGGEGKEKVEGRVHWAYLCDFNTIYLKFPIWMRLLRIEYLLDRHRPESIFPILYTVSIPHASENNWYKTLPAPLGVS